MILSIVTSCTLSKKEDSAALTDNYIKLCYGIPTEVDTSNFMEHAMQLLNASDYRGCLALFKTKYPKLDTVVWHSGFHGLIIPDSNIQSYKPSRAKYNPIDYLSFRYNNFMGDLANDEQGWIFSNAVDFNRRDEKLYKLQEAENIGVLGYDSFRIPDSVVARNVIKKIVPLLEKDYNGSRRVEYILACAYLVLGDDAKATPIYDRLIAENYYALPCLKNIIKYLGDKKRMQEQEKYVAIFNKMFPNECLLLERYNQLPADSIKTICKNCIWSGTERDSIKAGIFLANYFLNERAYRQFDSLTTIYFEKHEYGSYDPLKKYEETFYSDGKILELFLLKQYAGMYSHYHRHFDKEENKKDFKEYVKQLYATYMPKSPLSFEAFFKKYFW